MSLFFYKEDFTADAELHFHGISHGKGPCDGLGGNLKRLRFDPFNIGNLIRLRNNSHSFLLLKA